MRAGSTRSTASRPGPPGSFARPSGNGRGSAAECGCEGIPRLGLGAEAARRGMASPLREPRTAGLQRAHDVEVGGRAHRATDLRLDECRGRHRTPELIGQAPGHQAEQTGRPSVVSQGNRSTRERSLGGEGAGGGNGGLGQLASPKVHRLELVQQPFRRCRIALHQQVQRQLGVGNAPCSVQARHDPEPDVAVGGVGRVGAGSTEQALQPVVPGGGQLVQPHANDHTALPGHGRHIGDRPEGGHRSEVRHRDPVPRDERGCQPVRDPGPGQIRIGVDAVRTMGVDHGHRRRQHRSRNVVIGDDDVHPQLRGEGHLGHVAHPAVASDHELDASRSERAETIRGQAVSLRQPRGDVANRVHPKASQGQHPDRDRGHAIGVVVAPDRNRLPGRQRGLDAVHRALGIGHQGQGREIRQAGAQESGQALRRIDPPPGEKRRNRRTEPRELRRNVNRYREEPLETGRNHVPPW